jgi:protein gp37
MSKIAWTDHTWNPIVGCSKVSPGCANCYAEKMAWRLQVMGQVKYQEVVDEKGWTGSVAFCPKELEKPLHWKKTKRIFVCSMSDFFHPRNTADNMVRVMNVVRKCPKHTFQILTKRPEVAFENSITLDWFKNVWLGVTAENQEWADKRIPILLKIPAAVRFVSLEPLLGPVDLDKNISQHCLIKPSAALDWFIVGCESGPKRRPCKLEWVRSVVNKCQSAGTPCFVKQIEIDGKVVHDIEKFPPDLQVQEYPETATRGRE